MSDPTTITTITFDWSHIISTFIATIPMMIAAFAGLLTVLKQIGIIHAATNSMKDALIAATAKTSFADGLAQGVLQEQARIQLPQEPVGFKAKMHATFIDPW